MISNSTPKKRKILIINGSRGEYGYIRPILNLMKKSNILEPQVLATNMHLLPEFGNSVTEFSKDNFRVDHKIYMALSGYTNTTMIKSLGVFMLSMADILTNQPPDLILVAGDRGEQLVAAIAGAHANIPIAHIQAGEVSGNVDGLTRNAIARFCHIHFASNEDAAARLIKSGEEPFRVFNVGAPQLDEFYNNQFDPPKVIEEKFSLDLSKPIVLMVQHPVTEQSHHSREQMLATMQAILELGHQTVIIYPNNDAGSTAIQEVIQKHRTINVRVERNVTRTTFGGLLNVASVIVGNSSSGLIEAPVFKLPAINIGRRQKGRLGASNVINVETHSSSLILEALKKALAPEFRDSLQNLKNPYGDGHSSERIVRTLETIQIDEILLYKQLTY